MQLVPGPTCYHHAHWLRTLAHALRQPTPPAAAFTLYPGRHPVQFRLYDALAWGPPTFCNFLAGPLAGFFAECC